MDTPTITLDENEILSDPSGSELDSAVEQTTDSESSTEEPTTEAATEAEEPAKGEETEGDKSEEEVSSDEPAEETDTDQPKERGAEARKEQLAHEIRDLVSQRNVLRDQVSQANAQAYQPATADQLMDQGLDEATARVTALEQRTQMAEFNAHVSDLNANLNTEALQVMHDYPMFDPKSPEYNQDLAGLAESVYARSAGLKTDPKTGLVYEAAVMPYQVFQAIAKAHESGASNGQVKAQRSAEKMLASADTPTSAAPKQPREDSFLSGLRRGLN